MAVVRVNRRVDRTLHRHLPGYFDTSARHRVRAEYPELYDAMERYFVEFGEQKKQEGEEEALRDVIRLLDDTRGTRGADPGGLPLPRLYEALVERLEALLS